MRGQRAAGAAGVALAGATDALGRLRPAAKPLHPRGRTVVGRLERHGSPLTTEVPWLDGKGSNEVVVRLSRAAGLPRMLPDVHGLAMRTETDDGLADLLLASTGWSGLTRFIFAPSRDPRVRPLTSLLPYRSPIGPVLIGARAEDPDRYVLSWARGLGRWWPFAELVLTAQPAPDQGISFDPIRHPLPGLEQYPSVVRLREPSYARVRQTSQRTMASP